MKSGRGGEGLSKSQRSLLRGQTYGREGALGPARRRQELTVSRKNVMEGC